MKPIYPCLWFNGNGEEAGDFYVSVFPNSRIVSKSYYGPGMPLPEGTVLTIMVELNGREFMLLNAGPEFTPNEAVSLVVPCKDQAELDAIWGKLSASPENEICGWCKDKYGFSWQVAPAIFEDWLTGDKAARDRMMQALMQMKKLDIAQLTAAYEGRS
jgi:predicted 3-demethylubiquinone-9 3-methyltransferase (glyoxalase superfamily)